MVRFVSLVEPPGGLGPGRWYFVRDAEVLVSESVPSEELASGAPVPVLAESEAFGFSADTEPIFLGELDGLPCWAVGVLPDSAAPQSWSWTPLRHLGLAWDEDEWVLAGRAVQLVEWFRTHRFCGRCSTPTVRSVGERAMRCPECSLSVYPRLAPAVIVLVRRGDQALLAHGARFPGRMFSTLAGFVEPGETLEEAVAREVYEEVGVEIHSPRYVASQPWPFPHSVMIGFVAEWARGEITPDGEEISEARWWDADGLPPIPPPMSIARRLIDDWVEEVVRP